MARKDEITADIIRCVAQEGRSSYQTWRIGVTHDVRDRRKEWNYPEYFQYWKADSIKDAQAIALYFVSFKGMQPVTSGDLDPERNAYVYVF